MYVRHSNHLSANFTGAIFEIQRDNTNMGNPNTLALLWICLSRLSPFWTGAAFSVLWGYPGERNEDLVGNLPVALKTRLAHIVQAEMKIIGVKTHKRLQSSFDPSVLKLADRLISDALSGP